MSSTGRLTIPVILDALRDPPASQREDASRDGPTEIMDLIRSLHRNNLAQWDREDDARRRGADDAMVAAAKRDIDRLNRNRHDLIEAIDVAFLGTLDPVDRAPLVTESPGMAIDRLSVLVIRLDSTRARATGSTDDARLCAGRLPRLKDQLLALEEATATLLEDLASGARRFLAYESFKLYGRRYPGPAD